MQRNEVFLCLRQILGEVFCESDQFCLGKAAVILKDTLIQVRILSMKRIECIRQLSNYQLI
jgi:hypothetical protein